MSILQQLLVKIKRFFTVPGAGKREPVIFAFCLVAFSCLPLWFPFLLQHFAVDGGQLYQAGSGYGQRGAMADAPGRHFAQSEGEEVPAGLPRTKPVQTDDMLRFHVRAHSNSPADQKIKNFLAQKVLARYQVEWKNCRSSDELGLLLAENKAELKNTAREILETAGCSYDVDVSLTRDVFPARCYEGKLFPAGEYTALYLVIGEGRGENWWCVLFPPLCFSIVPPVGGDVEEGESEAEASLLAAGRYTPKRNVVQGSPAPTGIDRKNNQEEQAKNNVEVNVEQVEPINQEERGQKWRFWLWEVIAKKLRRQQ